MGDANPSAETATCRSCFATSGTVPVQVRRGDGEPWVNSSIVRCANDDCWNTTGGTVEDRLVHISNVYDYKYFGDYELSAEQFDAVYEAYSLARLVPDLLSIARMAADGTYIPPQHAREVLERHGLVPGKDER